MTALVILILILTAVIAILSPFFKYELAKRGFFFTLLESGNIAYVYWGDTLVNVLADVRGKKLVGHKLVPLAPGEKNKPKRIHWIGIPPFASIKKFKIERKKEVTTFVDGMTPSQWIQDLGEIEVNSLRGVFTRPFLLMEAELGERQTVNALVVAKFEVVDTYIPVALLKGQFLTNTTSTLQAAVNDILKAQPTMDQFLIAPKGEDGILSVLKNDPISGVVSAFNKILEQQVGLHLVGATIPQWDPSDKKVRDAMNAKFIAEKEKEAAIVASEAYALQLEKRNEADALAIERLAKAHGEEVKKLLEALAQSGATPQQLNDAAAKIMRAKAQPNLTTLVEAGATASPIVIPATGGVR